MKKKQPKVTTVTEKYVPADSATYLDGPLPQYTSDSWDLDDGEGPLDLDDLSNTFDDDDAD